MALYVYILGLSSIAAKLLAWGISAWNDKSREFRCVRVWLGVLAIEDVLLFSALRLLGLRSLWYARIYYGADLFSILCGLFVLLRLAEVAFDDARSILPFLRRGAILTVAGLIIISAVGVGSHLDPIATSRSRFVPFAQELEQNMNVAGMLAAAVLWGTINALAVPGVRLRRLAAAIGVSYSAGALSWSFYSLFYRYQIAMTAISVVSTVSIFLIGWTLAFEKETAAKDIEVGGNQPLPPGPVTGWAGSR